MSKNPLHRVFDLLTGQWSIFLEQPVPIEVLDEERIANSLPSFGFFVLLITSTIIATFGLIANNTAVVIGAMIVAPLMNPILSMAYGISIASSLLIRRSLVKLIIGTGRYGSRCYHSSINNSEHAGKSLRFRNTGS